MEYQRVHKITNRQNKCVKRGYLWSLIAHIKEKNSILTTINIPESTIHQRAKRGNILSNGCGGHVSPLTPLEPSFVSTIIQPARIRQCITPSQGLKLINSVIEGTLVQEDMLKFKLKCCSNRDGMVGLSYWYTFIQRNSHLIVSKKGQKSEIAWISWSIYHNFNQMYSGIREEMVEAKVSTERTVPV